MARMLKSGNISVSGKTYINRPRRLAMRRLHQINKKVNKFIERSYKSPKTGKIGLHKSMKRTYN